VSAHVPCLSQPSPRLTHRGVRVPGLRCGAFPGQLLPDGARELVIPHQRGAYRLRLTRNDQLIRTK